MGCFIFSITIITSLYLISLRPHFQNNGFVRRFFPHPTSDLKQINIGSESFYISGITQENIFLSNYSTANELLIVDHNLKTVHRVTLHIPNNVKILQQSATVSIDSSIIYIMEGVSPYILHGSSLTFDLNNNSKDTFYFNKGIPISESSYILRIFNQKLQSNILVKLNSKISSLNSFQYKLNKQVDGILCTEGTLQYDRKRGYIVYVYNFQNSFVCLDTNLSLIYESRTIDTNTIAKIKIANLSPKVQTFAAPPLYVNKQSCIYNDNLFVYSGIRANNEDITWFDKGSTIDVYSLKKRRYLYSFYIADFERKKISCFNISANRLFILQGSHLSSFQISF